jgi:hypothetical protein
MPRFLAATIALIYTAWRHRRGLIIRAMESSMYTWGMRWIVPRVRFWFPPVLPDWKVEQGRSLVLQGDVLLTADTFKLTNICIPGALTHAAVYLGWGSVVEMICSGYHKTDWAKLCRASRVVILRPLPRWDQAYQDQFIAKVRSFEGTAYDPQFEPTTELLYCSEMVWTADWERRLKVKIDDLMGLGRPYVSPMGLYNAGNVEVIWDSDDPLLTPEGNET